jgi:hypothetical protein
MALCLIGDDHQGARGPGGPWISPFCIRSNAHEKTSPGAFALQNSSLSSTRPFVERFRERLAVKQSAFTIPPTVVALADKMIK